VRTAMAWGVRRACWTTRSSRLCMEAGRVSAFSAGCCCFAVLLFMLIHTCSNVYASLISVWKRQYSAYLKCALLSRRRCSISLPGLYHRGRIWRTGAYSANGRTDAMTRPGRSHQQSVPDFHVLLSKNCSPCFRHTGESLHDQGGATGRTRAHSRALLPGEQDLPLEMGR
jgi:hypothetical protein